jgi:hypothetical protein
MSAFDIALKLQDQFLECYKNDQLLWRVPIASILLIAEYTTNEGSHVDDYFIQLWSLEEGIFYQCSTTFYAAGRDAAFLELATRLKADVSFGLTGSTEWTSRIMWPPEMAGNPYFAFHPLKPVTWWQKLSYRLFDTPQEYSLTEEVQAFLLKRKKNARPVTAPTTAKPVLPR